MEIRESVQGEIVVLAPDGSITANEETSALEGKLRTVLKGGVRLVVVDCTAVTQLASGGVRALLMTSRKLDRIGGRLVLCAMNARLQKAFAISGIDKDFVVAATAEEAMRQAVEASPPGVISPPEPSSAPAAAPTPDASIDSPVAPPVIAEPTPEPEPTAAAEAPARLGHLQELAAVLLEAMGVHTPPANAGREGARGDLDALAGSLMQALQSGGS